MVGIFVMQFILPPQRWHETSLDSPFLVNQVLISTVQGIPYDIVPLQGVSSWHQGKGTKSAARGAEWLAALKECNSGYPSVVEQ